MEKPRKPPEKLGSVPLNSGGSAGKQFGGSMQNGKFVPNATAEMIREVDPGGAIVSHPVRKSPYVHERLHSTGKIVHELYDAAEKFRMDFERAQLFGNYARLDMFKTRSGKTEMSDRVAAAKIRINKALESLGRGKDGPNFLQSCSWNVIGSGLTLEDWTGVVRNSGGNMNADKASGILHAALELLAQHYGMIDQRRAEALRQESAYGRAIRDFLEFTGIWAATTQGIDKSTMGKFVVAAQKRFSRFAT